MILGLSKLAVRNTLRRGKKSWITVIGVFIGIAAVVSLVSLGQGLEVAITQEFEELGSNQVIIQGDIDDSDIEVVERTRGVDAATGLYQRTAAVKFRDETQAITVVGANLQEFDTAFLGLPLTMEEGRKLRNVDSTGAMLGTEVRNLYEDNPGIRSQMELSSGDSFRVVGLYSSGEPQLQNSMIISLERARTIWDVDDDLTRIVAIVDPGFTQEEVAENIEDEMLDDRDLEEGDEDFSVTTPQDVLETLTSILSVVQGIVVGLASIALLVGGIGIMNTMYMSINERTQEIGVLKAIGASKRQIRMLFLIESGLIGLIGGIIGVLIGIGISEIVVYLASNYSTVAIARGYTVELIIGSLMFATVLGLISGYLPSRRASNLDPAEALRYE
ncbi:MAG: ABC transporter permease [Candidatus Nanohaloarchaea archaeon]